MEAWIALGGYLMTSCVSVVAFLLWRRSADMQALVDESYRRYEIIQKQMENAASEWNHLKKKSVLAQEKVAQLDKELVKKEKQHIELSQELERERNSSKDKIHQLELRNEHYKQEMAVVLKQIKEAEHKTRIAEQELILMQAKADAEKESAKQPLKEQIELTKKQLDLMAEELRCERRKVDQFKELTAGVEPKQFVSMRRKLKDYDYLYRSMRGLKEMTEERNLNFEAALRKLSGYVLRIPEKDKIEKEAIGKLVGDALEVIGGGEDGMLPGSSMDQ
jgi:chromosome segregation ATPase